MKIIQNLGEVEFEASAVAIGKFDGVHIGHNRILSAIAGQKDLATVVFSFTPSPGVFFGVVEPKELMTREEKRARLAEAGVDFLVEFPFHAESAATPPDVFLRKILCEQLHMKYIAAGPDVSYGAKGAGDVNMLIDNAAELGYRVEIIEKETANGIVISSTTIREALRDAKIEKVNEMLGYRYSIEGCVVHGAHLGTGLSMPTMNIVPPEDKLLPPNGVYYTNVIIDNETYPAISNIGCKPTVSGERKLGLETYVYRFDGDVYGKDIRVEFLGFERPEYRFENIEALKKQLETDKILGSRFHGLEK